MPGHPFTSGIGIETMPTRASHQTQSLLFLLLTINCSITEFYELYNLGLHLEFELEKLRFYFRDDLHIVTPE
jgi:hypothetical protein